MEIIEKALPASTGILIEDYDKGLLSSEFIRRLLDLARSKKKMIFVDPKFAHFFDYSGVTLFKPNRKEAGDALGINLGYDKAIEEAGRSLLTRIGCRAVLITLGENGMALFEEDKPMMKVPTQAVKVHDVSGAGDTVIATMAVVMSSGGTFQEAASISNHAAGIVCGEVGIVPVDAGRLMENIKSAVRSEKGML
jgi:rfaE bifunctional protein kinase chain/domain